MNSNNITNRNRASILNRKLKNINEHVSKRIDTSRNNKRFRQMNISNSRTNENNLNHQEILRLANVGFYVVS